MFAGALGVFRMRFFCFRCSSIYGPCMTQVMEGLRPKEVAPDQRAIVLAQADAEIDREVRAKISGRLNGDAG